MSTLTVTAEPLTIHEHTNADALELAQVGLYRAVVPKGVYRTGQYAIYIPEQSVLPADLIEELGLTGKLGGKQRDRVTTVRLRGEISQGIVCCPTAIREWFGPGGPFDGQDLEWAHAAGINFADLLGITKWVPPIPVHMAGEVEPAADLIPWVEIENIKRYPDIFTPGEHVVATEKIHGTAGLCTYVAESGQVFVSSKGFGSKRLAIKDAPTNLYWRAVRGYDVPAVAATIAEKLGAVRVGVFGEVYGKGIQDLGYATDTGSLPGFAVFDIAVDLPGGVRWLNSDELVGMVDGRLPLVPRLYAGPYDEVALLALAEGVETVSGTGAHIREGIVVRPAVERRSAVMGGRAIGKLVSSAYLTRKGGTEYE